MFLFLFFIFDSQSFLIPILFQTYEEIEAAFALPEDDPKKLFSSDFKKGVLLELKPLIAAMRKVKKELGGEGGRGKGRY